MVHIDCDCILDLSNHIIKKHNFKPNKEILSKNKDGYDIMYINVINIKEITSNLEEQYVYHVIHMVKTLVMN